MGNSTGNSTGKTSGKTAGKTAAKAKDAGWEVGVRTTVNARPDVVWGFLLGEGMPLWLGRTTLVLEKGAAYATDDDIRGRVLTFTDGVRVRVSSRRRHESPRRAPSASGRSAIGTACGAMVGQTGR